MCDASQFSNLLQQILKNAAYINFLCVVLVTEHGNKIEI